MGKRFLRLPEVRARVGLSKTSIYSKISTGEFPAPLSLGGRVVAWLESDVDAWIDARIEAGKPELAAVGK